MNPNLVMFTLESSSTTIGEQPLIDQPITMVAPSPIIDPNHVEMVEDSKEEIISDVWWAMAKRIVVLAMREASSDVFNIERRVQSK